MAETVEGDNTREMPSFSDQTPLTTPDDLTDASTILAAINAEIGFNRRRAGQVFFFSLLIEGLILAGRQTVAVPSTFAWARPLLYSTLFMSVAAVGIALGFEYRRRIHILKDARQVLLAKMDYRFVYPLKTGEALSEIQVLYVVLLFLSSAGIILAWLIALFPPPSETSAKPAGLPASLTQQQPESWGLGGLCLFWLFLAIGVCGVVFSVVVFVRWAVSIARRHRHDRRRRRSHGAPAAVN